MQRHKCLIVYSLARFGFHLPQAGRARRSSGPVGTRFNPTVSTAGGGAPPPGEKDESQPLFSVAPILSQVELQLTLQQDYTPETQLMLKDAKVEIS